MKCVFKFFIRIYQLTLSKVFSFFGFHCKFYPSCSEYTMQAIDKYGVFKGIGLGFKRIMKCNIFSKGGYDPLK